MEMNSLLAVDYAERKFFRDKSDFNFSINNLYIKYLIILFDALIYKALYGESFLKIFNKIF